MKNKLQFFKNVFFYFEPFKWVFALLLFLIFIENSVRIFSSYFLGKVVDSFANNSFQMVLIFASVYLIFRVIPVLIEIFTTILSIKKTELSLRHHFGRMTLRKSLKLSLGQIKNEHSGIKQDIIKNGENALDQLHMMLINEFVMVVSSIAISLFGLGFISIKLFFVAVIFLIVYFSYTTIVNKKMKDPLRHNIELRKEKSKISTDIFRNLFFIKFSGQDEYAVNQLKKYQSNHEVFGIKLWTKYHMRLFVADFLQVLFFGFIIFYAIFGVKNGIMTIGMFLPIATWMGQLSHSLSQISSLQRRFTVSASDLVKMFDMLDQKTDIHVAEKPMSIKNFENKIKFENVDFDYADGKKGAMKNVNLEIKKGEKVALVGKSGSGKSTIVSLLLRLYDPTNGDILVDGIDIKELKVEDWYNLIAYVPQDGDLIDMTIKENVLFGAQGKETKGKVAEALKQAQAYDFVLKLPHGLDTKVGERGVKLSGGQKQRICIARALVKDAQILILDEATSSLDSETEQFLNKNIWDILENKTGIVIAHRLSTIMDADKIVVVDDGAIIGIGKHKKLLKECEFYKNLVNAQNISF